MSTDPQCVFCRIVAGTIPASVVYEDDDIVAFLDVGPLAPGHLLLVTRRHYSVIDEVPAATAGALGTVLPRLVAAARSVTGADAFNILQNNGRPAGQEVGHVHVHVIPRRDGDGLGYRWHPQTYGEGEAERLRDKYLEALG
jgi:histidine triad (HIT) family protein